MDGIDLQGDEGSQNGREQELGLVCKTKNNKNTNQKIKIKGKLRVKFNCFFSNYFLTVEIQT